MTGALVPLGGQTRDDRIADLTAQFLKTRRTKNTRRAYHLDLTSWLSWCREAGLHPIDARPGDVLSWLSTLAEAGTTRARRLSAVSSWYKWLIRHGAAERNPAQLEKGERPVLAPRKAPALSEAHTERLLAEADADRNPRTAAIVWLLLTTGIRVGELVAAEVGDIGIDSGVTVLQVRGKGEKSWPVEIEPYTWHRLDLYLSTRADVDRRPALLGQAGGASQRPLIATRNGRPVDPTEVRRLLIRLAKRAKLPAALIEHLTPHSTRATLITASIAAGVPLRHIQRAVGHASSKTTEGYDRSHWRPENSPARRVAERFHADRVDALRTDQTADTPLTDEPPVPEETIDE